jgi:hypothetical protein
MNLSLFLRLHAGRKQTVAQGGGIAAGRSSGGSRDSPRSGAGRREIRAAPGRGRVFLDRAGGFVVSQWKRRKDPGAAVMTSTLAASFRALFTTLTVVAVLAVLGSAGLVWYAGYGLVPALGLLIGGLILVVAAFGLVAIQIENNELLAVIAEALTDPATARAPEAAPLRPQGAEPLLLRPAPEPAPRARAEPVAAAPRGRVEPVLSARRG